MHQLRPFGIRNTHTETSEMGTATQQKPHVVCMHVVPCSPRPHPRNAETGQAPPFQRLPHRSPSSTPIEFNYNRILASSGPWSSPSRDWKTSGSRPFLTAYRPRDFITVSCHQEQHHMAATLCRLLKRLNEVAASLLKLQLNSGSLANVLFCSASACGFMGSIQYIELEGRGLVPPKSMKLLFA